MPIRHLFFLLAFLLPGLIGFSGFLSAQEGKVFVNPRTGKNYVLHTVKKGETLQSIAKSYETDVTTIEQVNIIDAKTWKLQEGTVLRIPMAGQQEEPAPTTLSNKPAPVPASASTSEESKSGRHIVQSGETLYSISRQYGGVPVKEIIAENGLDAANPTISPGQELIIPGKTKETPKTPEKQSTSSTAATPIIHTVQQGETLYSISRKYNNVPVRKIIEKNRLDAANPNIKPGQELIIPTEEDLPGSHHHLEEQKEAAPQGRALHIVKPGETLFSISRMYEGISVAEIAAANSMEDLNIHPGQSLWIPTGESSTEGKTEQQGSSSTETALRETIIYDPMNDSFRELYQKQLDSGKKETVHRGIVTWMPEETKGSYETRYFALHKTAPSGALLRVTNLMNDRVVFVKVVGRLPEISENKNIVAKLSPGLADFLGVLDSRFLAEMGWVEAAPQTGRRN